MDQQDIRYLSVSALNRYLKARFERDKYLRRIYIKGEISNLSKHHGHFYFTLKDEQSRISAIMFSSSASKLLFDLEEGMNVLISGSINIYENGGTYSLIANSIELDGIGSIYLQIEQTKKKLYNEGLFDPFYKKPIPKFPRTIGLITADGSAAYSDLVRTINRRYPFVKIYPFFVPVQGKEAYKDIIKGLKKADQSNLDVLILARGGGSIEDLMNFNEEALARTIFQLNTPIITGVGHEIDHTIVDYVSDLRASTPTGAAELCVPDTRELIQRIKFQEDHIVEIMNNRIQTYRYQLNEYEKMNQKIKNRMLQIRANCNLLQQKILLQSKTLVSDRRNRIQNLVDHSKNAMVNRIQYQHMQLDRQITALQLLSPLNTLKRGYSIVSNKHVITDIYDIHENDRITIRMANGQLEADVNHIIYQENRNEE